MEVMVDGKIVRFECDESSFFRTLQGYINSGLEVKVKEKGIWVVLKPYVF